ncbi:lycopene cyclase domain-containing protein [Amycolatopsis jiangsuensis]|uniref:Lycopene cyclase domain-containing protein n=1 Tax=Amycolatopsis jiangsuensis TaxID=1181879 RepID=A0A840J0M7_9PSEU|nr:lycopene cyclase domain-containing protein [Amycolatopsis jiangsuensis]MBB4686734.1 lycopene cyclase domain-containing protein [Amycolatopsis jiangsuensis]
MNHAQYLFVLAACVVVTLPLELSGSRVYRRPRRLARAVLPVAVVFLVWDALAIAAEAWRFDPAFVSGVRAPFGIPLEEVLFFVVVPICGLLTYETVVRVGRLVRRNRRVRR